MEDLKIQDCDLDVLNKIAKKHNLSLDELGRLLTEKKMKRQKKRLFLEVDDALYCELAKKAKLLSCTLSNYAASCCVKAIETGMYKNMDMRKVRNINKDAGKMSNYINISMDKKCEKVLIALEEITEVYNVYTSPLLRYFVTNVVIEKKDLVL